MRSRTASPGSHPRRWRIQGSAHSNGGEPGPRVPPTPQVAGAGDFVRSHRLVALTAVGKIRVAVEAARSLKPDFADGVEWRSLSLTDPCGPTRNAGPPRG